MTDLERLKEALRIGFQEIHIYKKGDMANFLGYTTPYFSGIINGKEPINANFLNLLSDKLNINIDYIKYGTGEVLSFVKNNVAESAYHRAHAPTIKRQQDTDDTETPEENIENIDGMIRKYKELVQESREILFEMRQQVSEMRFLASQATQALTNAINLNRDMQNDHKEKSLLYEKMYNVQQGHIERAKEYLEGIKGDNSRLRSDIQAMIDAQTQKTEDTLEKNFTKVLTECKTVSLPSLEKIADVDTQV